LGFFLRGVISPVPSQVTHFSPWLFPVPRQTGHIFAEDLGDDDIKESPPHYTPKESIVNAENYPLFFFSAKPEDNNARKGCE